MSSLSELPSFSVCFGRQRPSQKPLPTCLLLTIVLFTSFIEFAELTGAQSVDFRVRSLESYIPNPTPAHLNVTRPKGCVYNKQKYSHGDIVKTEQSCLKCTCKKGVLLCALRVCPPVQLAPLIQSHNGSTSIGISRQCRAVKDANHCCPKMVCTDTPTTPGVLSTSFYHPTLMPSKSEEHNAPSVSLINFDKSILSQPPNSIEPASSAHKDANKTYQYQNRYPDKTENSPFLVSRLSSLNVLNAAPEVYSPDDEHLSALLADSGNHCYLNGTFYEEGSAIVSSTYCEYCYCIRGKRMCIRPRCHLSIMGCLPKYSSEFACCPTSYACGNDALATSPIPAVNLRLLDTYSADIVPENVDDSSPTTTMSNTASDTTTTNTPTMSSTTVPLRISETTTLSPNSIYSDESTTSATTTVEPITTLYAFNRPFSLFSIAARSMECEFEGLSYAIGDAMPANENCNQCYCAANGQRICNRIHCSLPGDHKCVPIIPEGHCCPIEYKCEKDIIKSTFSYDLLQNDPPRSRSLEESNNVKRQFLDDTKENYPNINKVVRLLSTFLSEVHRRNDNNADSNFQDVLMKRELRSDANDGGFGTRIQSANTFSNGWRAMPKNKNKYRSNPNWMLRQTTERPSTTPPTTTKTSILPVSTTTISTLKNDNATESNKDLVHETTSSPTISSLSSTTLTSLVNENAALDSQEKPKETDFSTSKCIVNGREYSNGEILPKSTVNPCNYCRCFYGKEICQEQQCPSPPSSGCVSERVEGQCCPTFTCRSSDSDTLTPSRTQIRHVPQFERDSDNDTLKNKAPIEVEARIPPHVEQSHIPLPVPQTKPHPPQHRLQFPVDALPRPIEQLLFMGSRIHFPSNGNSMPGLRLPPNLPPQLIMNLHKKAMNNNAAIRPHFRPGQIVPVHILPIQHQFPKPAKESPIRTLPQSPIQIPATNTQPQDSENSLKTDDSALKPNNHENNNDTNSTKSENDMNTTSTTSTTPPTITNEKNPWDIFKISGCNIYGKVYRAGEKIDKLSDKCKQCICSSHGVQCNQTC